MNRLPIVDLTGLRIDGPDDLARVARDIRSACEGPGFFYVTHHGVPEALLREAFELEREFFALPLEAKMAVSIEKSRHMRGYFSLESESPEYTARGDLKEGFDLSLDLPCGSPRSDSRLYGPNAWPAKWPRFREILTSCHAEMLALGLALLRAFAVGLDIREDFFADKFTLPLAQLRLLHYPPQKGLVTRDQMGAGEHTDFGCITLLAQDDVGGLEVRTADGTWISMPPIPGTLIVNIGDLMALWTHHRYRATWHRVINRAPRERYSMAFFLDPNADVEVVPIGATADADTSPPVAINVNHYMNARFDATFGFRAGAGDESTRPLTPGGVHVA